MNLFQKMSSNFPLHTTNKLIKHVIFSSLGGFLAIAIISFLAEYTGYPLVMGSFGASCVLLFGFPESPFSQPKNVVLGHFISTFIGLTFLHLVGPQWWSMALALSVSIGMMIATNTVHPPAGSNPVIVFLAHANWSFIFMPSFIGSVSLVIVALVFINCSQKRYYPKSWR